MTAEYIVAHPGTLITYPTKAKAVEAARDIINEHKKDVQIHRVEFVENWEPVPEEEDD